MSDRRDDSRPVVHLSNTQTVSRTARVPRRFQAGDAYWYEDELWLFRQRLPQGFLLFVKPSGEPLTTDRYNTNSQFVNEEWVDRNIADNKFRRANLSRTGEPALPSDIDRETAICIDPKAPLRKALMEAIDRHGARPSRHVIQSAINSMTFSHPAESIAFGEKPTVKTVRNWLSERGSRGHRTWAASISMQGKVIRRSRLDAKNLEILTYNIAPKFWGDPLMSMATALSLLDEAVRLHNAEGKIKYVDFVEIPKPSRSTMWRHILSFASFDTFAQKYGKKRAEKQFSAAGSGRHASTILELCMMDHTVLDNFVVDSRTRTIIGRPIITILICVYSRCIVGYYLGFNPAGLSAVIACLKNAFKKKLDCIGSDQYPILQDIYGRPAKIIVDNGLEFVSRSLLDVSADLGIAIEACPVKTPTYKAIVERFFGILNSMGVHSFPGTSLNKQKKLLTEYNGERNASLTLEQLKELIDRTIYLYHIEAHGGLNKQPPALLWQKDAIRNGIQEYENPDALDVLMGVSDERAVKRDGVEIHGLKYQQKAHVQNFLNDYPNRVRDNQKFKVKYDPENIGSIHVYHPKNRRYYELPCVQFDYADGLSLFAHEQIKKHANAEGQAFSTLSQRHKARAELYHALNQFNPQQSVKNAKATARILESEAFKDKARQKGACLTLPIARIPQDTFVPERKDDGALAEIPRRGRAKAEQTRKRNLERKKSENEKSNDVASNSPALENPTVKAQSADEGY